MDITEAINIVLSVYPDAVACKFLDMTSTEVWYIAPSSRSHRAINPDGIEAEESNAWISAADLILHYAVRL